MRAQLDLRRNSGGRVKRDNSPQAEKDRTISRPVLHKPSHVPIREHVGAACRGVDMPAFPRLIRGYEGGIVSGRARAQHDMQSVLRCSMQRSYV